MASICSLTRRSPAVRFLPICTNPIYVSRVLDHNFLRRPDAETHPASFDVQNLNNEIVADPDGLIRPAREGEHCGPFLAAICLAKNYTSAWGHLGVAAQYR